LRRLHASTSDVLQRARFLPACVEILVAAGDLPAAGLACAELEQTAARFGTEVLTAMANGARGVLFLAEGDPRAAVEPLRRAFGIGSRVPAPSPAARVRVRLAEACAAQGDVEGAALELAAARSTFEQLGAAPDLAALPAGRSSRGPNGLTEREVEVLRLV